MWFIKQHILRPIGRFIPVAALLVTVAGISFGQQYYHSPNDTLVATTTVGNSVTLNITQVHPGNDTLYFVWNKVSEEMPDGWTAKICDNAMCYPDLTDAGQSLPVLPGDDGLMLLHCYPEVNAGTGIIRYAIYEMNTPEQVDTLTWIVHADATAGLQNLTGSVLFNWTGTTFQLLDQTAIYNTLRLFTANGQLVFERQLTSEEVILPVLNRGIYIVELTGAGQIITQKLWHEHN